MLDCMLPVNEWYVLLFFASDEHRFHAPRHRHAFERRPSDFRLQVFTAHRRRLLEIEDRERARESRFNLSEALPEVFLRELPLEKPVRESSRQICRNTSDILGLELVHAHKPRT